MTRVYASVAGLVFVALIGLTGFIALSDRVTPFTEQLQREDDLDQTLEQNRSSALLQFDDTDGQVSLTSEIRIIQRRDGMYDLRISSSHIDAVETHLDSLSLSLDTGQSAMPEIALRTPGGHPWEPMTLQRDKDGQGVTLDIPDLGFQGTGTVTLEFLIDPGQADGSPDSLWLDFQAQLHQEKLLKLTAYEAETLVEIPMPGEG